MEVYHYDYGVIREYPFEYPSTTNHKFHASISMNAVTFDSVKNYYSSMNKNLADYGTLSKTIRKWLLNPINSVTKEMDLISRLDSCK